MSAGKTQVEHHLCLSEILREFKDRCNFVGFRTRIADRPVMLKFFIQFIAGDTAGHNNLCYHFQKAQDQSCHRPRKKLAVFCPDQCHPMTTRDIIQTNGNEERLRLILKGIVYQTHSTNFLSPIKLWASTAALYLKLCTPLIMV